MTYELDFLTLPDDAAFERRSVLIGPTKELKDCLSSMPHTLERVESAIMFAAQSSKQTAPWRAAAFLRAALADFSSIKEMQGVDQGDGPHFAIASSSNPLLHLLELMRHMNIHVKSVQVEPHKVPINYKGVEDDMDVYVVSNLQTCDLTSLKNGRHYNRTDLKRCVAWFNSRQTEWGAGDLIIMGTILFAEKICTQFDL